MKRVQLAGDPNVESERILVGLERELRVDMGNDSLRLHDGVKVGGYEFLNRDQSFALFQPRSLELDGFNFGSQEKGILVRVGPASYKIRRITVDSAQLAVTNPRGTLGDIHINLLETISTNHIWTGAHQFTQPIDASGGVVGNVTGNLTGDSAGTHTGNVIGDATGNHTGSFTGDVDTRGAILLMDDGQIPENYIDPQAFINRGVPYGTIIMWSGDESNIPETWALCDGTNGTPDLRERFILAAGATNAAHTVGGSDSITVTGTIEPGGEHTHSLTVAGHVLTEAEIPAHDHGCGVNDGDATAFLHGTRAATGTASGRMETHSGGAVMEGNTTTEGGDGSHGHPGSTADEGGAHTHDITLDNVAFKPSYYALCFLMKIV